MSGHNPEFVVALVGNPILPPQPYYALEVREALPPAYLAPPMVTSTTTSLLCFLDGAANRRNSADDRCRFLPQVTPADIELKVAVFLLADPTSGISLSPTGRTH